MGTDVVISFDTTGSMSPCIHEVRQRVTFALSKLFDNIPDLRIGIISHGDYCDNKNMIHFHPLSTDITSLRKFVETAPNTSGGDGDEFYEYVLRFSRETFAWESENKILIMIGDANPHQVGYKYGGMTYYLDWIAEAQALAEQGINIYSVQALGSRSSVSFYEKLAGLTNGRKLDLYQFSDAVETIISICYHKAGKLEEYREELESTFKLNRNLAEVLRSLDVEVKSDVFTRKDKSGLIPVSPSRFQIVTVTYPTDLKSFVESIGATFRKGRGFYQFTKSELVQENKEVILRNKLTGDMFTGAEARSYIGLPFGVRGQLKPHFFEDYEVYIQSTSSNRKLVMGTKFLYET